MGSKNRDLVTFTRFLREQIWNEVGSGWLFGYQHSGRSEKQILLGTHLLSV